MVIDGRQFDLSAGGRFLVSTGYELDAWWFGAIGHGAGQNALFKGLDQLSHGRFVRCRLDF
jgi:hypothetical protein